MSKIKQWISYNRKISNQDHSENFEPLHLTVGGKGGSGKTTLIRTLLTYVRKMFDNNKTAMLAAPTGASSYVGGGLTMHRLFSLPIKRTTETIGREKEKT